MLQMLQSFQNVANVAYVRGFQRLEESVGQLQLCLESRQCAVSYAFNPFSKPFTLGT